MANAITAVRSWAGRIIDTYESLGEGPNDYADQNWAWEQYTLARKIMQACDTCAVLTAMSGVVHKCSACDGLLKED